MRHVERRRLHENSGDNDNEELRQVDDGQEKSMLASKALCAGVCTTVVEEQQPQVTLRDVTSSQVCPLRFGGRFCLPFPCDHWSEDPVPFFNPPPCPC